MDNEYVPVDRTVPGDWSDVAAAVRLINPEARAAQGAGTAMDVATELVAELESNETADGAYLALGGGLAVAQSEDGRYHVMVETLVQGRVIPDAEPA